MHSDRLLLLLFQPFSSIASLYAPLVESANICKEVYRALSPRFHGDIHESYDTVVARVARAKLTCAGGSNAMTSVNLSGQLITSQLRGLAPFKDQSKDFFNSLPFFQTLRKHMKTSNLNGILRSQTIETASIRILDDVANESNEPEEEGNVQEDLDLAMAQRLQAEEEMRYISGGRKSGKKQEKQGESYLRMEMREYADDYPVPSLYKQITEEVDELMMADAEVIGADAMYLPHFTLTDFSVYNEDGLLTSLELLPTREVEADIEIFASGVVKEVNEEDFTEGGISVKSCATSSCATEEERAIPQGIRIFTSDIKQLNVNSFADMIFVSIRTSAAHYKLLQPSEKYAPWFGTLIKVCRIAVYVHKMVSEASRPAKISFHSVVASLKALDKADDCFISSTMESKIEKFLVVHGQIIMSLLLTDPKKTIKNCPLVSQIKQRMAACRHSKLYMSSKAYIRAKKNPLLTMQSNKPKQMISTTTKGVYGVWESHFQQEGQPKRIQLFKSMKRAERCGTCQTCLNPIWKKACLTVRKKWEEEMGDDLFESDVEDEKDLEDIGASLLMDLSDKIEEKWWSPTFEPLKDAGFTFAAWRGKGKESGRVWLYDEAKFEDKSENGFSAGLNDAVLFKTTNPDGEDSCAAGIIQSLWEDSKGRKFVRLWSLVHGEETVLGNAAGKYELFIVPECIEVLLDAVVLKLKNVYERGIDFSIKESTEAILGEDLEKFFYRKSWDASKGLFADLPDMQLGEFKNPTASEESMITGEDFVIIDGVKYEENDFVYVDFNALPWKKEKKNGSWKGNSNYGLHSFHICQIVNFADMQSEEEVVEAVEVRRFYRPEDVGADKAYKTPMWEVFYSEDIETISCDSICGKCTVYNGDKEKFMPDVYFCQFTWNRKSEKLGKCKVNFDKKDNFYASSIASAPEVEVEKLATMDMFAGCGGLTEGMHQAGVVDTRWAIEFDEDAAEAFRLNHAGAVVYSHNCNSLLLNCVRKAGLQEYLSATIDEEAINQADKLSAREYEMLPLPGQVDFICGGPPCQGFSGMNRFTKSTWSKVQNDMVLGFLSYADIYRPKYFLLENVRNFVAHNKGQTFRLVVRTLLELGYQVRFGVLNAGNFGVSQARKRLFIWGAAPGCKLPEWPKPLHTFACPQISIPLPNKEKVSKCMHRSSFLTFITHHYYFFPFFLSNSIRHIP